MLELLSTYGHLYRDPILAAILAGLSLGLLGVYVVSRRIVFVSAALSQTSALGVTLGFFLTSYFGITGILHDAFPPAAALILSGIVVTMLVTIGERPTLGRDAVLGMAFIIPTALVLLIGPYITQELHEIEAVLHGSAVLVRKLDLYAIAAATLLILIAQLTAFRGFIFVSLDPIVARTQGLPARALDAVLFGSIALMTGLATRALGALPTFALTILPAIGALSLNVGLSGGLGYLLALSTDWSVGASQALVATLFAGTLRAATAIYRKIT